MISDRIWPSLDGNEAVHFHAEQKKLKEEIACIHHAAAGLRSNEDQLKEYLRLSERLLEDERSRRNGVESRLLNAAGLVSIAGTVVLGAMFSLASDTLKLSPTWTKGVLSLGCLYLALQLVAALRAAVLGLKATSYPGDMPHDLLPTNRIRHSAFLRRRIKEGLNRVAEHRFINNRKVDQLNLAHCAMENFLWGLLAVAVLASITALLPSLSSALPQPNNNTLGSLPHTGIHTSAMLIFAGVCMSTLGVVLIATNDKRRVVGVAITMSGVMLGVIGSVGLEASLFRFDKLIADVRLELPSIIKNQTKTTLLRRVMTIGPFPDGDHTLPEGQVEPCAKDALAKYKGLDIGGWEVVGRVDKRLFKPDRVASFGTNQTLAMSRANWVSEKILHSDLTNTVISIGGARHIGKEPKTNELQSDRAVDVFAMINVPFTMEHQLELPNPAICPNQHAFQ